MDYKVDLLCYSLLLQEHTKMEVSDTEQHQHL